MNAGLAAGEAGSSGVHLEMVWMQLSRGDAQPETRTQVRSMAIYGITIILGIGLMAQN